MIGEEGGVWVLVLKDDFRSVPVLVTFCDRFAYQYLRLCLFLLLSVNVVHRSLHFHLRLSSMPRSMPGHG